MAKSKPGTASPENSVQGEKNGEGRPHENAPQTNGTHPSTSAEYGAFLEQAKIWVEGNQTAAMISGFGFGVFIGVLLRR